MRRPSRKLPAGPTVTANSGRRDSRSSMTYSSNYKGRKAGVMTTDSPRLILSTPSDREIVISRVFNAPRRLVWDAWTKPEYVARWFGAVGWTVPVCEIDLRPGGTYRYVMRSAEGQEVTMRGVYRGVVPPERLV